MQLKYANPSEFLKAQLPDWTSLPQGFIVNGKYEIIKALINGSGGSVYLAKPLNSYDQSETATTSAQDLHQFQSDELSECSNFEKVYQIEQQQICVLKIYTTQEELSLFQNEIGALTTIGRGHVNLVKVLDAKYFDYTISAMIPHTDNEQQTLPGFMTKYQKTKTLKFTPLTPMRVVHASQQVAYIAFDYCSKSDLFTYVKSGCTRYQEKLCHSIFYQLLCGLQYLHQIGGMAHLDIKLENIALDENYCAKFLDMAFCESLLKPLVLPKGTENYYPPEIVLAKELVTKGIQGSDVGFSYSGEKADIFSLGVLLFIMYFGSYPLKDLSVNDPLYLSLTSGSLDEIEYFFKNHCLTKRANRKGLISDNLKMLFVKMFNLCPQQRPSVVDLLMTDAWVNDSSICQNLEEYQAQMESIYQRSHSNNVETQMKTE